MPHLTRVPGDAGQRSAIDDDPATHAYLPGQEEDVVGAHGGTPARLREGAEVGLVRDGDRDREIEDAGEAIAERHVEPAEVWSHRDEAVRTADDAHDRDADSDEAPVCKRTCVHSRCERREVGGDGVDGRMAPGAVLADERPDDAAESDERNSERVDVDLERDDDAAVRVEPDPGRRPARRPAWRRWLLNDEIPRDELGDEPANRAPRQTRACRELRTRRGTAEMQLPDDRAQVRAADCFAALPDVVAPRLHGGLCSSLRNVCARLVHRQRHVKSDMADGAARRQPRTGRGRPTAT